MLIFKIKINYQIQFRLIDFLKSKKKQKIYSHFFLNSFRLSVVLPKPNYIEAKLEILIFVGRDLGIHKVQFFSKNTTPSIHSPSLFSLYNTFTLSLSLSSFFLLLYTLPFFYSVEVHAVILSYNVANIFYRMKC